MTPRSALPSRPSIATRLLRRYGVPKHAGVPDGPLDFDANLAWALYQQGLVAREIGRYFNKSANTVRWHLRKRAGYASIAKANRSSPHHYDVKVDRTKARTLRELGMSYQATGRTLGVSFMTVYSHLKDQDISRTPIESSPIQIPIEWSTDEERIQLELALHQSGKSLDAIASLIGTSRSSVYRDISNLQGFVGKSPLDPSEIIKLHKRGLSAVKIAAYHGVSVNKVTIALKKHPEYVPLDDRKVDAEKAWEMFVHGLTSQEIADFFEVRAPTVRRHLRRRPGYAEIANSNMANGEKKDRLFPRDEAWQHFQDGHTLQQLADHYGVDVSSIQNGIKHYPGYKELSSRRSRYNESDPPRLWQHDKKRISATCAQMVAQFRSKHFYAVADGKRHSCLGWRLVP